MESSICQNCKKGFVIGPEDFLFYEKIKVPLPTWCPRCRAVRRFLWRNDKKLYRRKNDSPESKDLIISIYDEGTKFPVYDREFWFSDKWDPKDYRQDYDFSKSFFEQWKNLYDKVPHPNFWSYNVEHSPYTNYCGYGSYLYMCAGIFESEHCAYSYYGNKNVWVYDSYDVNACESSYEVVHGLKIIQSSYVWDSKDIINCHFVYDCSNCQDCFMSSNLRNKRYVFKNKQYDKDTYLELIDKEGITGRLNQSRLENEFLDLVKNSKHRYMYSVNSQNVTGDSILNSENIKEGFVVVDSRDSAYLWRVLQNQDVRDAAGLGKTELGYELVVSGINNSNIIGMLHCGTNYNCGYCTYTLNSHDCFGCVGLRNAQFCILNKQYSKEEYYLLVDKIKKEMVTNPYIDEKGKSYSFGDFFPTNWSPFEYDSSYAGDFYSVDDKEAIECGYKTLKENGANFYKPTLIEVPETIFECDVNICEETLPCPTFENNKNCKKAFRIEKDEFVFYQKMKLPIPRMCPSCRSKKRMESIRGVNLRESECISCKKQLETTYPEGQGVYCESCYQNEVL